MGSRRRNRDTIPEPKKVRNAFQTCPARLSGSPSVYAGLSASIVSLSETVIRLMKVSGWCRSCPPMPHSTFRLQTGPGTLAQFTIHGGCEKTQSPDLSARTAFGADPVRLPRVLASVAGKLST